MQPMIRITVVRVSTSKKKLYNKNASPRKLFGNSFIQKIALGSYKYTKTIPISLKNRLHEMKPQMMASKIETIIFFDSVFI